MQSNALEELCDDWFQGTVLARCPTSSSTARADANKSVEVISQCDDCGWDHGFETRSNV